MTLHPNEHNEREISLNTVPVSLRQESKQSWVYLSQLKRWCLDLYSCKTRFLYDLVLDSTPPRPFMCHPSLSFQTGFWCAVEKWMTVAQAERREA